MKKKILLTLVFAFLLICLTGCSANYTLKYENGVFTETVNVVGDNEDEGHPTYDDIKNNGYKADISGLESFVLDPGSSSFDVTLTHELKDVKLNELKAVSECFTLNTYEETDSSYFLSLYGDFICTNLNDSSFILETKEKVIIHNAHKVKENQYIWNLNENDLNDKGIKFQIMKPQESKVKIGSDTMLSTEAKIVITLIIIGIGAVLFLIVKRVQER